MLVMAALDDTTISACLFVCLRIVDAVVRLATRTAFAISDNVACSNSLPFDAQNIRSAVPMLLLLLETTFRDLRTVLYLDVSIRSSFYSA